MNTRCPQCETSYTVDPKILKAAQGMARCYNCGTVFNAFDNTADKAHDSSQGEAQESPSDLIDGLSPPPQSSRSDAAPADKAHQAEPDIELLDLPELDDWGPDSGPAQLHEDELPFDLPSDLPELETADSASLDVHDTLAPSQRKPSPWWQKLLLLVLLLALAAQLVWLKRASLLDYPQARLLCDYIDCTPVQKRAPEAFRVVDRRLEADPQVPNALRLLMRFQNGAAFAQPLPRLQLSLFDSTGSLLARRLLAPGDYLFPAPAEGTLAQPEEVFTIELLFEDPGTRASGFKLDFL